MVPEAIRRKRDQLANAELQVNWCDDQDLEDYNMEGAPGGELNPFGWYVIGSTVGGGNGIVVHADDPGVYFADHEWDAPATAEGTRQALVPLASSIEEFLNSLHAIDEVLDDIG